jgi:hypothetical protein
MSATAERKRNTRGTSQSTKSTKRFGWAPFYAFCAFCGLPFGCGFAGSAKGLALGREACLQAYGAIAVIAGPMFGSVPVAAAAPCVRVLDFQQVEIFLPVRTLFRERCGTVTDFNPLDAAVFHLASGLHVAKILIAGN